MLRPQRYPLAPCLLASLALHALFFAVFPPGVDGEPLAPPVRGRLAARLRAAAGTEEQGGALASVPAREWVALTAAPQDVPPPLYRPREEGWGRGNAGDAGENNATPPPGTGETAAPSLRLDDYLPPSRLDRPPRPRGEIATDLGGHPALVGEAELLVLVAASGRVDAVLLAESTLPAFVAENAAQRFAQAEFLPGELAGQPVKSRLRIRLATPGADELAGNPLSARQRAGQLKPGEGENGGR